MNDMLLFTPYRIKGLELKNRLVMLPMGTQFANGDGFLAERQIDHYAKRAEGGVGLVILEASYIDIVGKAQIHMLGLHNDEHIPDFSKLAKIVHSYGAKIFAQLGHVGREAPPSVTGFPSVAPSPIPSPVKGLFDGSIGNKPKQLTIEEIEIIVQKFGEAARRAREAGLDGVELLCGHKHLSEQFLYSDSNQRQDKYGGSIENRARFIRDIVRSVRKKMGEDFIICCRVPATEYPEGGYTNKEIKKVFEMLEEAGTDVFNITVASSRQWVNLLPMAFPRGSLIPFGQWVKQLTNVPVICGVRINDPLLAEMILQENKVDLIGMGRALLCDPELPRKAMEGRFEDIRTCIACNNCSETTYAGFPITCTLNVELGRERELEIKPALDRKRILIIGGGPAGMEAARVAALRKHEVLLYEKASELGGQLLLAEIPPHKEEIANVARYLKRQIEKLGVRIELGKEVDQKLVHEIAPDVVIVATGASPIVPDIPGAESENVCPAIDILAGKAVVAHKVAIIGGGQVGVETAEFLADRGKQVVVVEMLERIAHDLEPISRMFMRQRLTEKGVRTLVGAKVVGIRPDGITVQTDGKSELIPAESIVLAVGAKPNNELANSLAGKFPIYLIGDCVESRGIMAAIHEASLLARQL